MSIFSQSLLEEIDTYIEGESSCDIFSLPQDFIEVNGRVTPVCSTFDGNGLVFILKIFSEKSESSFVSINSSDGGVFVSRSEETTKLEKLMFETEEGWTFF